jgi:hypothetical protein
LKLRKKQTGISLETKIVANTKMATKGAIDSGLPVLNMKTNLTAMLLVLIATR